MKRKKAAKKYPQRWPRAKRMVRIIITVMEEPDGTKLDTPSQHVFDLSISEAKALKAQLDQSLE